MKAARFIVSIISLLVIAAVGFGLYKLFTFKPDIQPPQMPPPAVTVAKPVVQAVDEYYDFTGTTEALEQVEIRARVQGFLEKMHFVEGTRVSKGDLLFEIERPAYQAMRDQAWAQLQASKADLARAEVDLQRVEQAVEANAVSQQEVTTKRAQRDQAQAAVTGAKAALKKAEQDLSYTWIRSPIDGRISRRFIDVGNLVGQANQTLLATVVRLKPIYVNFYISEELLSRKLGVKSVGPESTRPFFIGLENEPNFPHKAVLNYMDNTVDSGTGTILLRGELANEAETFLPGMFVRVRLPLGTKSDAVCVYDKALQTDIGGKYLLLVDDEQKVTRRPVKTGRAVGEMRVITSGLTAEDTYIVKGTQFARPGIEVNATAEGKSPPAEPNSPDQQVAQE